MPASGPAAPLDAPESAVLPFARALEALRATNGATFVELLAHGTLSVELYAPPGVDPQTPHSRDELYVVARGRAEFVHEGRRDPVAAGDLLFVRAQRPHRFEALSEDFAVWVMFYGPEGGERA